MEFQNIFLGGQASWLVSDIDSINTAITLAMQDRKLNNVVKQYFDSGINLTCDPRPLLVLEEAKPVQLDEPDVQQLVARLLQQGKVSDSDLGTTIFNLVLPPGTVLKLDQDNSLGGLGGYHGSVHFQHNGRSQTAYYSANVFSQTLADGQVNGIPAFDASWKDVVGTLYHEINEFRTDADVRDAIATGKDDGVLGWMGAQGEIGDQPIASGTSLPRGKMLLDEWSPNALTSASARSAESLKELVATAGTLARSQPSLTSSRTALHPRAARALPRHS